MKCLSRKLNNDNARRVGRVSISLNKTIFKDFHDLLERQLTTDILTVLGESI